MKTFTVLWFAALLSALPWALAGAEMALVPTAVSVAPASTVTVDLLVTNSASTSVSLQLASQLTGRLHAGTAQSADAVLTAAEETGEQTLTPGGFARVRYTFPLPVGFLGPVMLEVPDLALQPIMFSVQTAELARLANVRVSRKAIPANVASSHETALRNGTRMLPGVSAYEPVYFGLGLRGGCNAKFQLSLKYQPVDIWPFYLSYTQTSLLDLHTASKPFRDTSYKPRFFYLQDQSWVSANQAWRVGLEGGVGHESNGRGGSESRSINLAYVRPQLTWKFGESSRLVFAPLVYRYLDKRENPDIADYRGHADLYVGYMNHDWRLSTTVRKGTRSNVGSLQVDLVLPLRVTDRWFAQAGAYGANGFVFLEYFNGWGESIIDYDRKLPAQLRAGIMLIP